MIWFSNNVYLANNCTCYTRDQDGLGNHAPFWIMDDGVNDMFLQNKNSLNETNSIYAIV